MSEYIVQESSLKAVADKIRERLFDNSDLEFPDGFIAGINRIGEAPATPADSIIFYSVNEISIITTNTTKNWDGTLYYSTDYTTWTIWDGTEAITSVKTAGWHKLYLRGVGNTVISGGSAYRFIIGGSFIMCKGNMDNLLDYTTTPTMGTGAFANLFQQCGNVDFDIVLPQTVLSQSCYSGLFNACVSLTKTPELPATTLATFCYSDMFNGCKSLSEAPALPATTLEQGCYKQMFSNCNMLKNIPELPAITLTQDCYNFMFNGCKLIRISTTQIDEYQTPYRIPSSGTGTTASGAMTGMFTNSGGAFTGTAVVNTTYYTSNTIISAT